MFLIFKIHIQIVEVYSRIKRKEENMLSLMDRLLLY